MKRELDAIKNTSPDKIFDLMVSLSEASKQNAISFRTDNADNEYSYLNNVTKKNYMKKYNILVHDLEKRYKWFVSRLYYWKNKLEDDMHYIMDDNMDRFSDFM
jgi:hypothetical protein